ncbi:MAG: hypothetical protein M3Y72_05780 [Acidobacteriota bacterium]|nr:hypothetical protein [Acidobacteriota bacterium]
MSIPLHIRRAGKGDAAEIGRIHVDAARNVYSGIYTAEYLAGLFADERAARWTEEAKVTWRVAIRPSPSLSPSNGKMVGFADIGPVEESASSECAELFAIYLARPTSVRVSDTLYFIDVSNTRRPTDLHQ